MMASVAMSVDLPRLGSRLRIRNSALGAGAGVMTAKRETEMGAATIKQYRLLGGFQDVTHKLIVGKR